MYSEKRIQTANGSFQLSKGLNGTRCGWICRQLRKVADFVEDIPIIGEGLANKLNVVADIVSEIESAFKTSVVDYEPTTSETVILNTWQLKLQTFYRELSNDLADSFNQANISDQLMIVNEVLNKMCIVKNYFASNEKGGLSASALQLRNDLIDKIFEPHYTLIEDSFANIDLDTTTATSFLNNQTINEFYPLIIGNVNFNYQCLNYKVNSNIPNPANTNPVTVVLQSPSETPQTVVKSQDNSLIWIGVFIAGVLAITVFNNDDKKSKK